MIIDWLEEWFKGVLIDGIIGNLSGLFDTVNTKVGEIAADVGATPQGWNSGIFNMIRNQSAKAHSFQRRLQITYKGIYVNAGIADYHARALIDDLLRRVKNAHDNIPSVRDD